MRFIQTLYIDNLKDPFWDKFGWLRPEFHLMGWTLSYLQLKEFYGDIELYSNTPAAELLIDTLGLPYSKVHLSHDSLQLPDENLWALHKVYTYSLQETPFLHVDGDVFIFGKFPESLLEGKLIAQNIESFTVGFYVEAQNEIVRYFKYFPSSVDMDFKSGKPLFAVNAGIFGGSNMSFFKEYAKDAFEYINKNKMYFKHINVNRFNVFFEQHLFYANSKVNNIPINYLLGEFEDNGYMGLGDFHETPFKMKYLHLLGHFKRNQFTCLQMVAKLRSLYPEYFFKIIRLFEERNIPIYAEILKGYKNNYIEKDAEAIYNYQLNRTDKDKCKILPAYNENFLIYINELDGYLGSLNNEQDIIQIKESFNSFIQSIDKSVKLFHENYSDSYLIGRDLVSEIWYRNLFEDEASLMNKEICAVDMSYVFNSDYDWGRFYRKFEVAGTEYYENIELKKGSYYYIIINEILNTHFSVYDLDECEKIILDKISQPKSIKRLLWEMREYADSDILENYITIYETLIINFLKRLVLMKVIKPMNS
jgi:hypothetical protein